MGKEGRSKKGTVGSWDFFKRDGHIKEGRGSEQRQNPRRGANICNAPPPRVAVKLGQIMF